VPLREVVGRGEKVESSPPPLPLERGEGDSEEHPVDVLLAMSRGEKVGATGEMVGLGVTKEVEECSQGVLV
jgi:hypothetical protein